MDNKEIRRLKIIMNIDHSETIETFVWEVLF